jgi:hypothetical protein
MMPIEPVIRTDDDAPENEANPVAKEVKVNTPLQPRSRRWRLVWLAAAILWAAGAAAFILGYHFNQPSSVWAQIGNRKFYTHPPATTFYQRDHVPFGILLLFMGLTVIGGMVDLAFRAWRRLTQPGIVAIAAGGLLALYSLFGLIFGFLGIGTIGLFVILSGLPMKAVLPPSGWHPDPSGRFEYRYWDGISWGPDVATEGRCSWDPFP